MRHMAQIPDPYPRDGKPSVGLTTSALHPNSAFHLCSAMIDECFDVSPTEFSVGDVISKPGDAMGSSKILSLGR